MSKITEFSLKKILKLSTKNVWWR